MEGPDKHLVLARAIGLRLGVITDSAKMQTHVRELASILRDIDTTPKSDFARSVQMTLICDTDDRYLNSEITGWSLEDPTVQGWSREPRPTTIRAAYMLGWKLLAPPTKNEFTTEDGDKLTTWEWYFTKEKEV